MRSAKSQRHVNYSVFNYDTGGTAAFFLLLFLEYQTTKRLLRRFSLIKHFQCMSTRGGNRYLHSDMMTIFWVTIQYITIHQFVAISVPGNVVNLKCFQTIYFRCFGSSSVIFSKKNQSLLNGSSTFSKMSNAICSLCPNSVYMLLTLYLRSHDRT